MIRYGLHWLIVLMCALTLGFGMLATRAQETATPAAQEQADGDRPTTSDSGDMHDRLRRRIDKALSEAGHSFDAKKGFHWVILMQVAEYSDNSIRNTNRRRGIEYFIEDLVQSRRAWVREDVGDTVSIIPYHFNLLDAPNERKRLLRNILDDSAKLKNLVTDGSKADVYGDGVTYLDGHDWRRAMKQTIDWMQKSDMLQNCVVVVLDWNNLIQPPQRPATGPPKAGDAKYLIREDVNPQGWKDFQAAMRNASFPVRNLETVLVGNLEYDMAVFTPKNLQPIDAVIERGTPTPTPIGGGGGDGGMGWLLLLPLIAAAAFVLRQGLTPHSIQIEGQPFVLKALGNTTLTIVGHEGRGGPQNYVVPESRAPSAGRNELARLKVDLLGRLQANGAHCRVKAGRGCRQRKDGSVDITDRSSTVELRDNNGDLVTMLNISHR